MVLAPHTSADRPLGFEQVVQLCRARITREQAQTASATLCRDGNLDRIRPGVYQWSGGVRATPVITPPTRRATPVGVRPGPRPGQPSASGLAPTGQRGHPTAAELFDRLFPAGVRMNAELLADFDRWATLTDKFVAAYSEAS